MYNLHSLYLLGASFLDDHHQFIKRILLGVQERERLLAQVKEDNAEISVMERHIADMGDRWALIGPQLHTYTILSSDWYTAARCSALIGPQLHSAQLSLVHSCTILTSNWSSVPQCSPIIGPHLHNTQS